MSILVHMAGGGSSAPGNRVDTTPDSSPSANGNKTVIVPTLASPIHHAMPSPSINVAVTDADVDAPMPSDLTHPTKNRMSASYHINPLQSPGLPGIPYHSCFGLPYQDHNYGAPPPFTPPTTPPPPTITAAVAPPKVNGHIDIEDVSCHTTIVTSDVSGGGESGTLHNHSPPVQHMEETSPVDAGIDTGITRCICDFEHDDGYMICCDRCGVWQHVDCMGLDRNTIPDTYYCELCEPRKLDKHRAVVIQTKKRQFLKTLLDSSATETEDETPHGKRRKANKLGRKKKDKSDSTCHQNSSSGNNSGKSQESGNHKRSRGVKSGSATKEENAKPFKTLSHNTALSPKKISSKRGSKAGLPEEHVKPSSPPLRLDWSPPRAADRSVYLGAGDSGSTYEEAEFNQYSIAVESLLATGKFNGQHTGWSGLSDNVTLAQLQDQLCRVVNLAHNLKGLEVVENTLSNQPLVEYKGKVTLRDQFDKQHNFFNSYEPSVLFYSKFEGVEVCIDARTYGCDARFVRRSCTPNSEVRHFVEGADIHFYIMSVVAISRGEEVTIPFDFDYQLCRYEVKCCCSRPSCPVSKAQCKLPLPNKLGLKKNMKKKKKLKKGSWSEKVSARIRSPSCPELPAPSISSPAPKSPILPKSAKRRKLSPLKMPPTVKSESEVTSPPAFHPKVVKDPQHKMSPVKVEADLDKVTSAPITPLGDRDKKMTREEKKMEAIMKAFERLEKREERRKEAISRIHSHDEYDDDLHDHSPPAPGKIRSRRDTSKSLKDEPSDESESPSKPGPICDKKRKTGKLRRKSRGGESDGERSGKTSMSDGGTEVEEKKPVVEVKSEVVEVEEEAVKQVVDAAEPVLNRNNRPKKGKRKGRSLPASRRQSRANSSVMAPENLTSPDEMTSSSISNTSVTAEHHSLLSLSTAPVISEKTTFKFPKTKKLLMNEWLSERSHNEGSRPLTVHTGGSADNVEASSTGHMDTSSSEQDQAADFVRCIPSPHTNSLSHLQRRNSMSTGNTIPQRAVASAVPVDHGLGSAKKRWLRQAMNEHEPNNLSPVDGVSPSENGNSSSPGGSPIDFVTPLKKRRLARESLSAESPFPPSYIPVSSSCLVNGQSSEDALLSNGLRTDLLSPSSQALLQCTESGEVNGSFNEKLMEVEHLTSSSMNPSASWSRSNAVESSLPRRDSMCEEPMSSQGFYVSATPPMVGTSSSAKCHSSPADLVDASSEVDIDSSHSGVVDMADETVSSGGLLNATSLVCSVSCDRSELRSRDSIFTLAASPRRADSVCESSECASKHDNPSSSSLQVTRTSLDEASPDQGSDGSVVDSTEAPSHLLPVSSSSVGSGLCDSTQAAAVSSLISSPSAVGLHVLVSSAMHESVCSVSESSSSLGDRHCSSSAGSKPHSYLSSKSPRSTDISSSSNGLTSHGDSMAPNISCRLNSDAVCESLASCSVVSGGVGSGEGLVVSSSAAREEGELDSSYSDAEETVVTCSWLVEGRENEAQAKQEESEKEEGEITDDDSDDEANDEMVVAAVAEAGDAVSVDQKVVGEEQLAGVCDELVESSSQPSSPRHATHSSTSPASSSEISSSDAHCSSLARSSLMLPDHSSTCCQEAVASASGSHSSGSLASSDNIAPPVMGLLSEQFPITGGRLLRGLASPPASISQPMESSGDETAVDSSSHTGGLGEECGGRIDSVSSTAGDVSDSSTPLSPSSASAILHSKKKVSLLEYRKRLKSQGSRDAGSHAISGNSSCSSHSLELHVGSLSSDKPPVMPHQPATLAPLPIFGDILSSSSSSSSSNVQQSRQSGSVCEKTEQDVRWNASATLAERMREQTPLSLTERLRKEFGLDTSEADDSMDDNTDEEVPPPPPPPPITTSHQHTQVTHRSIPLQPNQHKYSPLPPPPIPPISLTSPSTQSLMHIPLQPPMPPPAPLLHPMRQLHVSSAQPLVVTAAAATSRCTSMDETRGSTPPINGNIPSLMSLPPPPHLPRRHLIANCEENSGSLATSSSVHLPSPHNSPKLPMPVSINSQSHHHQQQQEAGVESHPQIFINGSMDSNASPAQAGEISSTGGDLFPPLPPPPVMRGAIPGGHRINYNLPPSSSFH